MRLLGHVGEELNGKQIKESDQLKNVCVREREREREREIKSGF